MLDFTLKQGQETPISQGKRKAKLNHQGTKDTKKNKARLGLNFFNNGFRCSWCPCCLGG
jgi:hypothetical protein